MNALDAGIADISHLPVPNFPGRFPYTEFLSDSPACYGNGDLMMAVLDKLFEDGLMKEYDNYVPLYFSRNSNSGGSCLYTSSKKVTTMEDIKGLKIRARGVPSTRLVEALGGTPLNLAASELYMAAERGLLDGLITPPAFFQSAKLYEVLKYRVDQSLSGSIKVTVMSQKVWDSLPSDIQSVFKDLMDPTLNIYLEATTVNVDKGIDNLIQHGGENIQLDSAEKEKWKKVMDTVTDQLVADNEAKDIQMGPLMETLEAIKKNYD